MSDIKNVLDLFEEQKDFFDEKVSTGIEKYRKGTGKITVTDQNGNPVKNAKIQIKQKNHEFRFGANLFMLDEMENEEKNEAYKKYFADVFNMATLPFYWDALEPEKGKQRYDKDSPKIYRRPPIDLCIEFCEKNGIEPREHALAYDTFFPMWLRNSDVEEVKRETERRFAEIAERYADKIRTIEVTNEVSMKAKTALLEAPDYIEWCYNTAAKYFPNNQLVCNEYTYPAWQSVGRTTDHYYAYVEANMLKGARIDAIGMQYHLFYRRENLYNETRELLSPQKLYKQMDLYSRFNKPLQVTEVTIPSYSWEAEDEALQAEIIEKLYSLWFSHPNTEQIIYWNTVDGYAYVADTPPEKIKDTQGNMTIGENYFHGGLLRFDMTPKPAYYKIKELTQKTWHTELETETDGDGKTEFRGFYGQYELEITVDGKKVCKTLDLSAKKENVFTMEI